MNTNLKTIAKIAAFAGAFALTGCAFVPANVSPTYHPDHKETKIQGAESVSVNVVVENKKKHHDLVSLKTDSFEIQTAGVYMHLAKDFNKAITKALEERGFKVSPNGKKTVKVVITKFYMPEYESAFGQVYKGSENISAIVFNKKNDIIYNKDIQPKEIHTYYHIGGASRSAGILMDKAVNQLVNDPSFISALMNSKNKQDGVTVGKLN
ncbi:MAG: YajG family lipoprotein [Acidithiobacillus sp.]